jgi:hypothetical protein
MLQPHRQARVPFLFGVFCLVGTTACVDATGGRKIQFAAQVDPLLGGPYSGADDWLISLQTAELAVGPIYLWSDEPLLDLEGFTRRATDALVPAAHATETSHFRAGFLRGQVLSQARVDLLSATPVALAPGEALAGPSRSAELWLEPASDGPTLRILGQASRADTQVDFSLDLTFDDDWADLAAGESPVLLRRLRGLLTEAQLEQGGTLHLSVDPAAFFVGTDWSELPNEASLVDDRYVVGPETRVGQQISQRVRTVGSSGPYKITWEQPG